MFVYQIVGYDFIQYMYSIVGDIRWTETLTYFSGFLKPEIGLNEKKYIIMHIY